MAATSEESEGKPLQEKRLLCSKSFDSSTNKEDAFDSRKPSCNEMSKSIVPNENTVDICSLTEEQLHSLLEEATTFNRPKEQDSCILRALRKEIVESDPCGDVNTSDSSSLSVAAASVATVAGHCKRKGGRNVSATSYVVGISSSSSSRGSVGVKSPQQISDDSLTVNHQQTGLQGWTKSEINANSRRRWQNKGTTGREEYYASAAGSGANNSAKKGELQSQSLQDLPSTRFGDPLDSMRAAGIGRGNRRLHNATRANSFTYTGDGAEWLGIPPLQSQVSALDGLRTSGGRNSKSKTKSKTNNNSSGSNSSNSASNNNNNNNINNNPQTVLTIEDETDITRGTLSVSSTESNSKHQTNFPIGPKGWSPVTAPATSSPTRVGAENLKTPLLTFASCDNCDHSEVSLLSCRPLNDETEALENVKSNINGGLGVIDVKSCNETKTGSGVASSSSSPREIEMMELDKGKSQCLDLENRSTFVYNLEGNCRGGMDCRSDVDSQVSFPLKPGRVCSPANKNDIICASVQGQSTHINGILPMTGRSEAVKSIIGNDDSRKGGNNACRASSEFDKLLGKKKFTVQQSWPDDLMFYPNVDFNGNSNTPLMRMPTTFLTQGYSFDAHHNLNKTDLTCSGGGNSSLSSRKAKHSKSKAEKETYKKAEDVAGYCGQLEIDYLVDFINNSGTNEKKKPGGGGTKSGGTISGNVSVINNKNSGSDTGEKKKDRLVSSSSRDATSKGKNGFKRKSRGTGGNISSSGSSEEHNGPEPDRQQHSAESDDGDVTPVRNESPVSDKDDKVELSHHQLHHSVPTTTNSTTISPVTTTTTTTIVSITDQQEEQQPPPPLLPLLQPDIEFVEDFYAIAEIQAPVEESEFRVVVNKQRKKKQQKKSEPFRRYPSNSQNDRSGNNSSTEREFYLHNQQCHSSGMLIYSGLSHRNQRGKPDPSRRKSTSSMPPSEPSSADNSDLDSVHSLPVVGSMPPNTGPHPHTTPSSMSSTPQASYADIARMASAGGGTYSTTVMKKVETSPEIQQATSCIVTEVKDSFPKITETLPATAVPPHPPTTSDSKIAEKPNVVHVSTSPMVSIPTGIAKPKPSPPQQQSSFPHPQTVNPNPGVLVDRDVKSPELVERQDRVESPEVEIQLPEGDANKKRADFSRGSSQETVVATAAVPDSPSQSPRNPQNPTNTPPTTISTSNKSSGHGEILDNANVNPPVISETAEANRVACCVSFGFDEIELMRMSEGCVPVTFEFPVVAGHQPAASAAKDSNTDTTPNSVRPSVKTEVGINEPSPSAGAEGSSRAVDNSAYDASESNRMSSLGENVTVLKGGKRLRFKEKAEDTSSFNQGQIATLLGAAFDNVIQEVQKASSSPLPDDFETEDQGKNKKPEPVAKVFNEKKTEKKDALEFKDDGKISHLECYLNWLLKISETQKDLPIDHSCACSKSTDNPAYGLNSSVVSQSKQTVGAQEPNPKPKQNPFPIATIVDAVKNNNKSSTCTNVTSTRRVSSPRLRATPVSIRSHGKRHKTKRPESSLSVSSSKSRSAFNHWEGGCGQDVMKPTISGAENRVRKRNHLPRRRSSRSQRQQHKIAIEEVVNLFGKHFNKALQMKQNDEHVTQPKVKTNTNSFEPADMTTSTDLVAGYLYATLKNEQLLSNRARAKNATIIKTVPSSALSEKDKLSNLNCRVKTDVPGVVKPIVVNPKTAQSSQVTRLDAEALFKKSNKLNPTKVSMVVMQCCRFLPSLEKNIPIGQAERSLPMGTLVTALYREKEWLYVRTAHGNVGFIHKGCCETIGTLPKRKSSLETQLNKPSVPVVEKVVPSNDCVLINAKTAKVKTLLTSTEHRSAFREVKPSNVADRTKLKTLAAATQRTSGGSNIPPPFFNPESTSTLHKKTSDRKPKEEPKSKELVVIKDYDGGYKGVITTAINVKKGDIVTVVKNDFDNWVYVKMDSGKMGYIPTSCTAKVGFL